MIMLSEESRLPEFLPDIYIFSGNRSVQVNGREVCVITGSRTGCTDSVDCSVDMISAAPLCSPARQ